MAVNRKVSTLLGFAEEQENWLLCNRFFPSKIGGQPAWLELQNIPEIKDLLCDYCNEPCNFLCQVYAGSEHVPHAFHRTVFVFICKNGKCCSLNLAGNIKVLRSQLGLKNSFYPDKPSDETVKSKAVEAPVNLCRVCGCRGPSVCAKCKKVNYCGQLHQKYDWKIHKQFCGTINEHHSPSTDILFPEFEIVIEQEEQPLEKSKESEKEAETRRTREYEDMVRNGNSGAISEISEAELNDFVESKEDKTFGKFKAALENYESQVLRYKRGFSPLWISDYGILNQSKVPNCELCNGPRTFEFQIMPQMLNELKNYELDWGIIAVYTCERDCDVNGKYTSEYVYKQDIVKNDDDEASELEVNSLVLESDTVETNAKVSKSSESCKQPSQNKKKREVVKEQSTKKAFEENDEW